MNGSQPVPASLAKWWKEHPEKRSEFAHQAAMKPERREFQRRLAREVFSRTDVQEKSLVSRMRNPKMQKGPQFHSAKLWRLRDNRGRVHEFRSLPQFLRDHPELFAPEDVAWRRRGRHLVCRAMALGNLHQDRKGKRPFAQWKGWTWNSIYERRFNDGADLLARNGGDSSGSKSEKEKMLQIGA